MLGARRIDEATWELRGERRGGTITFDPPPAERSLQGAGTVHHVAWGTSVAEHPLWDVRLQEAKVGATRVIDRYYFHSIYFREPSGVLYEIADDGPGLHARPPAGGAGQPGDPAALAGAPPRRGRVAADAAARPARGLARGAA